MNGNSHIQAEITSILYIFFTDADIGNTVSKYLFNYGGESKGYLTNRRDRNLIERPCSQWKSGVARCCCINGLAVCVCCMLGMVWQSNRAGRVTALMRAHRWGPAALVASKAIELLHRLQETLRHTTVHPLVLFLSGMPWKCICTAPGKPTLICKANLYQRCCWEEMELCAGEEFDFPS